MYENILQTIGNTPLVKINLLNPNKNVTIYAKLEGFNPTGSIKDRIAVKMIEVKVSDDKFSPSLLRFQKFLKDTAPVQIVYNLKRKKSKGLANMQPTHHRFSSLSRQAEKFLDPQFPIVLQNIVGGACECRFGPNRKKQFPIISFCLRLLWIGSKRMFNSHYPLVPYP